MDRTNLRKGLYRTFDEILVDLGADGYQEPTITIQAIKDKSMHILVRTRQVIGGDGDWEVHLIVENGNFPNKKRA